MLLGHSLHASSVCRHAWRLLKLRERHQERVELTELRIRVHLLSCLHHCHLLKSLKTLLLHDQGDLVVGDAVKLFELGTVAIVCQLFDVFGCGEVRSICAFLFLLDYRLKLHTGLSWCFVLLFD